MKASQKGPASTKSGARKVAGRFPQTRGRFFEPLRAVHGLTGGRKMAEFLAALTSQHVSTSERQLAGTSQFSADKFVALLRSEHGFAFLEAAMGDHAPAWWARLKRQHRTAALRKQLAHIQRALADEEVAAQE
ncbi:MAG: hypothetical protein ACK4UO_06060 [Pseudolabrys sp.]